MADEHFLYDIKMRQRSAAYKAIFLGSPVLIGVLYDNAMEVQRLWEARVAKKSGRLSQSGASSVVIGGRNRDRLVGKASIAGKSVVAPEPWRGRPFYYGVLHETGSPTKKARFPGYDELRDVAQEWRGGS